MAGASAGQKPGGRQKCLAHIAALAAVVFLIFGAADAQGQGKGKGKGGAAVTPRAGAPIDLTGYWVSIIVDEWRFRVTPQKGDILYLPLNDAARKVANAWDPAKDEAEGNQCKAYGAIGVMQRPGRLHITWADDNTLKIEADAGTQTRSLRFGPPPNPKPAASWQGDSQAQWQVGGRAVLDLGGLGTIQGGGPGQNRGGTLKVVTTNMKPGYIRKNGVPYSENATLTEYFNLTPGQQNDSYFVVTATVEDPVYLTQPFVRTYTLKKQTDASGWDPTPCWNR